MKVVLLILAIVFCAVVPVILAIAASVADRNVPRCSKPPTKLVRFYKGAFAICVVVFLLIGLINIPISPAGAYWLGGVICIGASGLLCWNGFAEYGYN